MYMWTLLPPLPPCLSELIPRKERLNTLTLKNVLDSSLTELIKALSRVPTLRNLRIHSDSGKLNMLFPTHSLLPTGTINASCIPKLIGMLLSQLPQQTIAHIGSLTVTCLYSQEGPQPLPPCLSELIPRMERLNTLTLKNVLDTSLIELIKALSRVPNLRNLRIHSDSGKLKMLFPTHSLLPTGTISASCIPKLIGMLLSQLPHQTIAHIGSLTVTWSYSQEDPQPLPPCLPELIPRMEKLETLTLCESMKDYGGKMTITFNNNSIECQYCTTNFINQILPLLSHQSATYVIICNNFGFGYYQPLPPCLPELIPRMERLNTLTLDTTLDTSLTELIPVLSKVPTLRNLTLHKLNSEGITLLCQWLPTCQLETLTLHEQTKALTTHKISVNLGSNSIRCLHSTTEFIDKTLKEIPQQIIACVIKLVIDNEMYTLPPLPLCLSELIPRMERLNTLTLENVLDTSLTDLIPLVLRVPTLRNLTLHKLNNSKYIALLCQWLSTSQLEKLRLHKDQMLADYMGSQITYKIEITFCNNSIEVTICTKEFLDQILSLVPKQSLACVKSLTFAKQSRFSEQRVQLSPSLSELIPRMERLNTLKLESVLDTSLTELLPVLSRVPTLRNLALHKLNYEGITLLCQWLPTCQLETLKLPSLSFDRIEIVLRAFTTVSSPKTLNIEQSKFTFQTMQAFASMLQQNSSLTDVNITHCSIDSDSACCLTEALHHNTTLRKLDMSWNPVGERGALAMAKILKHNITLKELDLSHTKISSDGAVAMAEVLHHNTTLRKFDMRGNPVGEKGALVMAEMLKHNTTLEMLVLNSAKISIDGAVALAEALHQNTTLRKLDMSENPVGEKGVLAMAEMLAHNTTLEELDFRTSVQ